jgi:hypothetical protein
MSISPTATMGAFNAAAEAAKAAPIKRDKDGDQDNGALPVKTSPAAAAATAGMSRRLDVVA